MRQSLRDRCADVASRLPRDYPMTKDELEQIAREMLTEADLPEGLLGWTMVMISSEFWRPGLANVPPHRRLFLLPHCLKHAEGCPAEYDQFGMNCKDCGACSIADFRGTAEKMGYRVLVAEGSPVVMKIIVGGYVDAVVGVACLNVLEKAIDKILLAGIPCMAVPLLSSDCRNTRVDEAWVDEMVRTPFNPTAPVTRTYVHLMRAAGDLLQTQSLTGLLPGLRCPSPGLDGNLGANNPGANDPAAPDPILGTQSIAVDFLARGGKHSRPFITLAAYDAASGGHGTHPEAGDLINDAQSPHQIPEAVRRAAVSIETFHKASLVHDDIEDDDAFRYGQPSIHRAHGISTAINVGDYLIGLGYRLLSVRPKKSASVDPAVQIDLLDSLAAAHVRLSEGQGAELLWRDSLDRRLTPLDALKIYALKTAPAFEAALYAGVRLAAPAEHLIEPIRQFSRNLGVAFQILNDLGDWIGDASNKLTAGADVLAGRPTLLWALALERLPGDQQSQLLTLADAGGSAEAKLRTARRLYEAAGVFDLALQLVDKHQARAEATADGIENQDLRRLLYFLVDTVLQRPRESAPPLVSLPVMPMTASPQIAAV